MDYLIENKLIAEYLRELKLSSFKEYLDIKEQLAIDEHWTYRHFLCELMKEEYNLGLRIVKVSVSSGPTSLK